MVSVVTAENRHRFAPALQAMHQDRRRVFVDWLKWDLPVTDGLEIDQFDTPDALYLLALDPDGAHLGSVRLLPTTRPHILGDVMPFLCLDGVPRGPEIWELTRLCISPKVRDKDLQLRVRGELALGMIELSLLYGIEALTGTAHMAWLSQLLSAGWDVEPLGPVQQVGNDQVGAIKINITPATLQLFRRKHQRSAPVLHLDLSPVAVAA